jgi:hypothetical protein
VSLRERALQRLQLRRAARTRSTRSRPSMHLQGIDSAEIIDPSTAGAL